MADEKNWIREAMFYHIYPLGFTGAPLRNEGEATAGGRILEVLDWIEHFKELGINAIWIHIEPELLEALLARAKGLHQSLLLLLPAEFSQTLTHRRAAPAASPAELADGLALEILGVNALRF